VCLSYASYHQKTHLGWVVSGLVQSTLSNNTNVALVSIEGSNEILNELTIEQQVTKFWRIEDCSINKVYSLDEKICKHYFESTMRRSADAKNV